MHSWSNGPRRGAASARCPRLLRGAGHGVQLSDHLVHPHNIAGIEVKVQKKHRMHRFEAPSDGLARDDDPETVSRTAARYNP